MTMEKIAVIEDDASVQRALAIRLTSYGYRVVTADDVASAISMTRAENPALLLVDVCIPGGDGFQVVERIRRMPKMAHIPALFISASLMPGIRERVARLGATFLEKPFESYVLIAAVRAALESLNPRPPFSESLQHPQL